MAGSAAIPNYALFGEERADISAGFGHIETIAERSVLHDWEITPHRHAVSIQALLVQDGQVDFKFDTQRVFLSGPCYVVVPAGVVHGFTFRPETFGHVLTLSAEFADRAHGHLDPLLQLITHGGHSAIQPRDIPRIQWLVAELMSEPNLPATQNLLFLSHAETLMRILAGSAATSNCGRGKDDRIARFRALIEENLGKSLPLEFYARQLGITPRTLGRICNDAMGCSPLTLVHRRKLLEAQRLLRYTNATIVQVANELGFADPSYFSRFYLRSTGQRPISEKSAR